MKAVGAWLLCLLLLGLALQGAASRAHQHSMEIRSECPAPPPPPGVTGGGLATSWAGASLLSIPGLGFGLLFPRPFPQVARTGAPKGPGPAHGGGSLLTTRVAWG